MTLNDLLLLLRRYLKWVIIVPVLCALLLGGFVAVRDAGREASYSASSSLAVADITDSLSGTNLMLLLNSTAQNAVASVENQDVSIAVVADDKTQSVKFTATASAAARAESAANEAAEATMGLMKGTLSDQASVFRAEGSQESDSPSPDQGAASSKAAALEACIYTVTPATAALNTVPSSAAKYAAVGLVGGLFLVLLFLALFDTARRPIKTRGDIAEATDIPVVNGDGGPVGAELVRANVLTACNGAPREVCVVSLSREGESFARQLAVVFESSNDDTAVTPIPPLSSNAEGYFEAQRAGATLVCVTRWRDSAAGLTSALEELKLARANVVGIVLV